MYSVLLCDFFTQPEHLLEKFNVVVTLTPMTHPFALRPLRDFEIMDFSATEGLGSSVTP